VRVLQCVAVRQCVWVCERMRERDQQNEEMKVVHLNFSPKQKETKLRFRQPAPLRMRHSGKRSIAGTWRSPNPNLKHFRPSPWQDNASSQKHWRVLQFNRSEVGTTNTLQCQVPVWRNHTFGPRTSKNIIIVQRWRGTWQGVPMAIWCSKWICRRGGGLVHHIVIIPPALSLLLLLGAAVRRAPTIHPIDWFCTRFSSL